MSTHARIKAWIAERGLRPKKRLGQNFLINDHMLARIAEIAIDDEDTPVVEIGAGPGGLTEHLAQRAKRVIALERDAELIPHLVAYFEDRPGVEIVEADVLHVNFAELAGGRVCVVGNIPYNITAPILLHAFAQRAEIARLTLMMQKEVGHRLAAQPGSKTYGSLSVLFQTYADIAIALRVGPGNFIPPPAVDSVVLTLEWLAAPRVPVGDAQHFQRVVRAAFSQRRKMLRNALQTAFTAEQVAQISRDGILDLKRRAETLTLSEFGQLAEALARDSDSSK